jgi:hypothetical protein
MTVDLTASVCELRLTTRSLAVILFAGFLCACSALSPEVGVLTQHRPGQPPGNYKQIIVDGSIISTVNTATTEAVAKQRNLTAEQLNEESQNTFRSLSTVGQVSLLRETQGSQLGDWMACLRIPKPSGMTYIAIFFEDEKILDYRTAVMMDHCEGQTYGPLPQRAPSPNKEAQSPKKGSARSERSRGQM